MPAYYDKRAGVWIQGPHAPHQQLAQHHHKNKHHHRKHRRHPGYRIRDDSYFTYKTPNPKDRRDTDDYNPLKKADEGYYHQEDYYFPDGTDMKALREISRPPKYQRNTTYETESTPLV